MFWTDVVRRNLTVALAATLTLSLAAFAQEEPQGAAPLTLSPGTLMTVRIDQALSSDRNRPGDTFSATLTQPLVAQGIVVAQRGQAVLGRVVDVRKGKAFNGNSSLQIALTRVTLVDGQSLPIRTELIVNRGRSSTGRSVGTVAATTGAGAVIGAAAGGGEGAGVGAGVGALAGVVGVLATHGYATTVYPETLLTFQTTYGTSIDTSAAPQAFRAVDPAIYERNAQPQLQPPPVETEGAVQQPPVVVGPQPVVYGYPYPYPDPYVYGACDPYWYPYCYGPTIRIFIGGGRWYRPYYRGWYHSVWYGGRYYDRNVYYRHYDRDDYWRRDRDDYRRHDRDDYRRHYDRPVYSSGPIVNPFPRRDWGNHGVSPRPNGGNWRHDARPTDRGRPASRGTGGGDRGSRGVGAHSRRP